MARHSQATVPLRSEFSQAIMTAESASRLAKTRTSIAATALWPAAVVSVTPIVLSPAIAGQTPFRVISSTGSHPQPAVLLVPGCSGFVANNGINVYDERAAELWAAGFLVVYVDHVGKRMQINCAHVGQAEVSADILEAVKQVAGQNGVDPSRISLIGWSYGGGGVPAALNAAPTDPRSRRRVLYYPVCRGAGPWSSMTSGLMLLGAADDIASPALCNAMAKGAPAEKLKVITYPNARHGFDMRGLPETQVTGAPAYNPKAAVASWAAVLEFLK
jgi:dienelactone hydrolase